MTSCSKPEKDNKVSYKTALYREKEFGTKFDFDFKAKTLSIFDAMYPVSEKSK